LAFWGLICSTRGPQMILPALFLCTLGHRRQK